MKDKKAKAAVVAGRKLKQICALPTRVLDGESLEILLLTSRETRRFVLPKGWPIKGRADWETAEIEAREEAGLTGAIEPASIGRYTYWKRMRSAFVEIEVDVYRLHVTAQLATWKEIGQRELCWVKPSQARLLVDEPGLISLIDRL